MTRARWPLEDYDLAATLTSGQAFRWSRSGPAWEGVVAGRWVRLEASGDQLSAEVSEPVSDWAWLEHYLGLPESLPSILATFPKDAPMAAAISACHGLRLLRQEPWECLASFILSSTKQIVQIQQCVALLSERFGDRLPVPMGKPAAYSFPTRARLAAATELELRACKLGFRARYLAGAARALASGELSLDRLGNLPTPDARDQLMKLPGVGPKIANCVLLFAYGRQDAFPVDVWVLRALRELYFPRRRPNLRTLQRFAETYFGPNAGYAQQYLFHYVRTKR
ncbi:MAG TPA: DNA glycosylase [Verrucomicrobiota bacterium]|nr:8-oxoguanine DNA glycosylase [Verrucomicrobiales bacterium]HRI14476.1 DNA glycosylase [Verrucomicrobiota bacterium]